MHGVGVSPNSPPRGRSPLAAPATPELAADDQLSVGSSEGGYASSSSSVGVPPPASLAAAVHEVPSLLSQLVSGNTDEQVRRAGGRGRARARGGERGPSSQRPHPGVRGTAASRPQAPRPPQLEA